MKKIKYLFLCLLLIPMISVNAIEKEDIKNEEVKNEVVETKEVVEKFNIDFNDNVTSKKEINGSSIIGGNNVDVENVVKGIDLTLGNNVTYNSNSDYSLVFGNTITMKGITNNDSFIFGNAVTFDKDYKSLRDLTVFSSSLILKGNIDRDVIIYASSVVIEDAEIKGNVRISATSIEIKNSTIEGVLSYNEDANIIIDENNNINLKETFKEVVESESTDPMDIMISYASTLFTFVVLALIFPRIFTKYETKFKDLTLSKFISMIGYGLLLLIVIPIIFALLLVVGISIPVSLLLLNFYVVIICLATIISGYLIGLLVWNKFIKKEINILLVGLVGITIMQVLLLIPYVNIVSAFISLVLSFSIVINLLTKDV